MSDFGFYLVQALTGLSSASALFLVASGLSIIFGVTRVVNFAHGSFYMLGAYVAYTLIEHLGGAVGFWAAVLLAGVAVGIIGVVVELLVLRRVYQAPELFQLVATFGVILVIQDLALLVWGAEDLFGPAAPGLEGTVNILGTRLPEYDLALIVLSLVVLGALWLLFQRTRWGTLVRAATEDREMVGALGVNQAWLFTGTFFLGSMLAGLGGAAQLPKGGADLLMDFNILAAVFVVVVVGGMGSIPGAFLAAVLISELGAFGILVIPQSTLVLMFVVMAVVLIFRPWGLLGRPEAPGQHGQVGPPEPPAAAAPAPAPGGGPRAARGAARASRVRGRLHPGARGRDRDHGPLRGEPPLRHGSGRDGLVRARRVLRRRRVCSRPSSSSTRAPRWRSRSSSPPRWPGCSLSSSVGSACA